MKHPYTDDAQALHNQIDSLKSTNKRLRLDACDGCKWAKAFSFKDAFSFNVQRIRMSVQRPHAVTVIALVALATAVVVHVAAFWPWLWADGGWGSNEAGPGFNWLLVVGCVVSLAVAGFGIHSYSETCDGERWQDTVSSERTQQARMCLLLPFMLPLAPTVGIVMLLLGVGVLCWWGVSYLWEKGLPGVKNMFKDAFPTDKEKGDD